ncbi:ParA family protein [Desertivirga xinjiangensis]|uniref:ParA family protein n=1 Tax=Desertivirga xinjiangensis TaxID=539206 RepID=UPI00210E5BDC|nr:ParA family protein [Pedobacter xinjiangensis]
MIILIGNQKGGAGKSTLTLLLANYLSQIRNRKVTVVDMDYQQSIAGKAEKEKESFQQPSYDVVPADLSHFPEMYRLMQSKPSELVLLDLPGKMDDDELIPIFHAAELIICPFSYDEFSVDSTVLFSMVIKKINSKPALVFIPNRLKPLVKYETKVEVDKLLQTFGAVTPAIPDRIDFQRITINHIPLGLAPVIMPILDLIYDQYLMKEEEV